MKPDKEECRKCVQEKGEEWSVSSEVDLQEGFCPASDEESVSCKRHDGQILEPAGRVHLV